MKERMNDLEALLYGFYMDDISMNVEVFLTDAEVQLERTMDATDHDFTDHELTARWEAFTLIRQARLGVMENYCVHLNSFQGMALELEAKRRY